MELKSNTSVLQYNTFGIDVLAKYFSSFNNLEELKELLNTKEFKENNQLILGGGSNILFTKNFDGIVLKNNIKGIEVVNETEHDVYLKVGAGENWHQFVLHTIENNFGGVENLSLIPGNVGASPMQNIGAYGVEIKDVFHELEAIHKETGELVKFDNKSCEFGYRESVFKNKVKNQFVITSVTYKLSKNPVFNTSYGAIEKQLEENKVKELSIKAISDAVIQIRQSKLPDPNQIGNAGSFFKNPIISKVKFEDIKKNYPNIASYPIDELRVKVAAGWLIDTLGWKGKTYGNYGVHKNQALVLVNYGGAKGEDVFNLSTQIIQSVKENFDIQLEREVNIY